MTSETIPDRGRIIAHYREQRWYAADWGADAFRTVSKGGFMEMGCVFEYIVFIQVFCITQTCGYYLDSEFTRWYELYGAHSDCNDAMSLFLLHGIGRIWGRERWWLWWSVYWHWGIRWAFHSLFVLAKLPWAMLAQRTLFTRAWKNIGRSLSTENPIRLSMVEELPG